MPTEMISQSVYRLQDRKIAIEKELADIDSRFRAIEQALRAEEAAKTSERELASSDGAGADRAPKKGRRVNRWFASGEAASLMKRYVRTPMTTPEIVKVLAHAKGFDNGLSGVQARRFQATAYMAVANAIKGGMATKLKDGRIRVR
jgi:hypothetical protein